MKKLFALLLLAGCTSTDSPTVQSYEPSMKAYIDCNHRNARGLAGRSEDALTLAIAAESMCDGEAVRMGNALLENFGPVRARAMLDRYEQQSIRTNVATIVRARG